MVAANCSIKRCFEQECFLQVPFFQRAYVWNQDNWEELLNTLSQESSSIFLGAVILQKREKDCSHVKSYAVIDGQQRLTTLSILLCACYDLVDIDSLPSAVAGKYRFVVDSMLHTVDGDEFNLKMVHSVFDRDAFKLVVDGRHEIPDDACEGGVYHPERGIRALSGDIRNPDGSPLVDCYNFFYQKLRAKSEDFLRALLDKLTSDSDGNQFIVRVELTKDEDAQAIFDVINSTGVRLTHADIIKNDIFRLLLDRMGDSKESEEKVKDLHEELWAEVFLADAETREYWEKKSGKGDRQRPNIELLLHDFACIRGIYNPDEHKFEQLSKVYREAIGDFTKEELVALLEEIRGYAETYRKTFAVGRQDSYTYADQVKRLVHILAELKINTFNPYVLKLVHEGRIAGGLSEESKKELSDLETLVVRAAIVHSIPCTKNYNKFCRQFLAGNYGPKELLANPDYYLDDARVAESLADMRFDNSLPTLLLFWIELYRIKGALSSNEELKYRYSLEHVMPTKWQEHWAEVPVYGDGDVVETDAWKREKVRARAIQGLGNMTILKKALNSKLRNKGFSVKKEEVLKNDLALLSVASEVYSAAAESWDERTIRARTKELAKEVVKIWPLEVSV